MSGFFNYENALDFLNAKLGHHANALLRIEEDIQNGTRKCLGNKKGIKAGTEARCGQDLLRRKGACGRVKSLLQGLQDCNAEEHRGICREKLTKLAKNAFCWRHRSKVLDFAQELDTLGHAEEVEIKQEETQYEQPTNQCDSQHSKPEQSRPLLKHEEEKLRTIQEERLARELDLATAQEEVQAAQSDLKGLQAELSGVRNELKALKKELKKKRRVITAVEILKKSTKQKLIEDHEDTIEEWLDVRSEVREKPESSVKRQLKEDFRESVEDGLSESLTDGVWRNLRKELKSKVKDELKKEVRESIEKDLIGEIREQLRTDLASSVKTQLKEELKAEVTEESWRKCKEEVKEGLTEVLQQHFGGQPKSSSLSSPPPNRDITEVPPTKETSESPTRGTTPPSTLLGPSANLRSRQAPVPTATDDPFEPYAKNNRKIPGLVKRLLDAADENINIQRQKEIAVSPNSPVPRKGYIYAYYRKEYNEYVKIGYTTKDVDEYLEGEQKKCRFEIETVPLRHKSKLVIHPRKVERMIHVELIHFRYKFMKCKCGKTVSHGEYFKIDFERAVEAINRWTGYDLAQFYTGSVVGKGWIWHLNARATLQKICEGIKEILPQAPVESVRTQAAIAVSVLTNDSHTSQEPTAEEDEDSNGLPTTSAPQAPSSLRPKTSSATPPPTSPSSLALSAASSPGWSVADPDDTLLTSTSLTSPRASTTDNPAAATTFRTPAPKRPAGPAPLPTPPDSAENLGQGVGQGHASDCTNIASGSGADPASPLTQKAERRRKMPAA